MDYHQQRFHLQRKRKRIRESENVVFLLIQKVILLKACNYLQFKREAKCSHRFYVTTN